MESWPIKYLRYLRLPLGGNPRALSFCQPVLEKMTKRLCTWKRNYLSLGGHIALIKSTLSNLLTYYMSIFKAPVKVIKAIEKMQRDFLWELGENRKNHLLSWEKVCWPVDKGGLGLGSITIRNDALLAKWLQRFPEEIGSMWHSTIAVNKGQKPMVGMPNQVVGFQLHVHGRILVMMLVEGIELSFGRISGGVRKYWHQNFKEFI